MSYLTNPQSVTGGTPITLTNPGTVQNNVPPVTVQVRNVSGWVMQIQAEDGQHMLDPYNSATYPIALGQNILVTPIFQAYSQNGYVSAEWMTKGEVPTEADGSLTSAAIIASGNINVQNTSGTALFNQAVTSILAQGTVAAGPNTGIINLTNVSETTRSLLVLLKCFSASGTPIITSVSTQGVNSLQPWSDVNNLQPNGRAYFEPGITAPPVYLPYYGVVDGEGDITIGVSGGAAVFDYWVLALPDADIKGSSIDPIATLAPEDVFLTSGVYNGNNAFFSVSVPGVPSWARSLKVYFEAGNPCADMNAPNVAIEGTTAGGVGTVWSPALSYPFFNPQQPGFDFPANSGDTSLPVSVAVDAALFNNSIINPNALEPSLYFSWAGSGTFQVYYWVVASAEEPEPFKLNIGFGNSGIWNANTSNIVPPKVNGLVPVLDNISAVNGPAGNVTLLLNGTAFFNAFIEASTSGNPPVYLRGPWKGQPNQPIQLQWSGSNIAWYGSFHYESPYG